MTLHQQSPVVDDDDDFVAPVGVRAEARLQVCPTCSKPINKHGVMELLECADAAGEQAEAARHWYMVSTRIGHERKVEQALTARLDDSVEIVLNPEIPGYVMVRCDLDHATWQLIKRTDNVKSFAAPSGGRPSPVPREDAEKFMPAAEPAAETFAVKHTNGAAVAAVAAAVEPEPPAATTEGDVRDAWTSEVPFPTLADGEVDYEALVPFAAAMRTVLERERDEIIRRGGPIEKQNIELKERLAKMLEDLNMWRRRAQTNAESRNSLQEQVDRQTKEIRKLRNELKGRKENNHVNILDIKEILSVVDKAPGWTWKMGGNGHYQIYKDGVWISDAASSGGTTRVNQATRVKLKKAGLSV